MNSMTGFGSASIERGAYKASATVRSVNHRFLDVVVRVGEEYRELEHQVRSAASKSVSRGRLDVRVQITYLGDAKSRIDLDTEAVRAIQSAVGELKALGVEETALSAAQLLQLPGVLQVSDSETVPDEEVTELARDTVAAAMTNLCAMRAHEGAALAEILTAKLEGLAEITAKLREKRPEVVEQLRAGLRGRLEEFLQDASFPEERLAQEAALLADKSDVQEELDRLDAHVAHFRKGVASKEAIGRRLDFLSQEILRELNTLGAKCRDTEMAAKVIDGKVICEQLKEQVQNVE